MKSLKRIRRVSVTIHIISYKFIDLVGVGFCFLVEGLIFYFSLEVFSFVIGETFDDDGFTLQVYFMVTIFFLVVEVFQHLGAIYRGNLS